MGGKTELSLEDRGEREEQEIWGDMKRVVVASDRAGASHGDISFILHVPKDQQSAPARAETRHEDLGSLDFLQGSWCGNSTQGPLCVHKGATMSSPGLYRQIRILVISF